MRDPNRISEVLAILQQGWEKVPNRRLGRLIENLKKFIGVDDLFYVEDDKMIEEMIEFFKFDKE